VEDTQGNLWIGSTGMLLLMAGKTIWHIPLKGLRASDVSHGVDGPGRRRIIQFGSVWITLGREWGWERFLHGQWSHFVSPALNGSTLVVMTCSRSDNTVWVGTANRGSMRFVVNKWITSARRRLSSDTITRFYQDHEGDIWVTTPKGVDNFPISPSQPYRPVKFFQTIAFSDRSS